MGLRRLIVHWRISQTGTLTLGPAARVTRIYDHKAPEPQNVWLSHLHCVSASDL
jgi:hypothetical protein